MVADDVDVVAGAAAVGLVCDHHLRSDHGDRRASRAGAMMQGDTARIEGAAMAGKDASISYADGTGSFLVLLAMAEQQGLFGKYGVDVRSVAVKGATVPRLTADMPLGMIGEPAALLQAAEGADLRLVASFSDIKLSGHLVARPGIKTPGDLRGKRLGARVIGAGLWISHRTTKKLSSGST